MSRLTATFAVAVALSGCATTGGKVAVSASALSAVVAASTFHLNLFCGNNELGPCPDNNTTSAVFAVIALASAVTGIAFETAHAMNPEPLPAATPRIADRKLDCSTVAEVASRSSAGDRLQLELDPRIGACLAELRARPPAIAIVDALAVAKHYATDHAVVLDDRGLHSRFDYTARRWVFAWPTATIVVPESGETAQ